MGGVLSTPLIGRAVSIPQTHRLRLPDPVETAGGPEARMIK